MSVSLPRRLVLLLPALAVLVAVIRPADLRPVVPELDGVSPLRAVQALRESWVPGGGFADKYPPLPSLLFGLAVVAGPDAPDLDARELATLSRSERAPLLWAQRDQLAAALDRQRWVSLLAMAAAAALVARLGRELALKTGATRGAADFAGLLGGLAFALSATTRVYAGTANVDALALLAALACVERLVAGRLLAAAALAGLATACKDPQFVLGPVVLLCAWLELRGQPRAARHLLAVVAVGAFTYLMAAGALTGPGVWWAHIRYLVAGGLAGVDAVDRGSPRAWWDFALHVAGLFRGAAGPMVCLAGLVGLIGLPAREGRIALAVFAATLLGFVAVTGFAYPRFVLLPLALLAAGAGVAIVCLAERAVFTRTRRRVTLAVLLALLAADLGRLVVRTSRALDPATEPRALFAAEVERRLPPGGRLVLFTEAFEHGPPLDPLRFVIEQRAASEAPAALAEWQAAPHERPELVGLLGFPTALPSGAPTPPPLRALPGDRMGGLFEVVASFGLPTGVWEERQLAARPTLTLLIPVSPP